MPKNNDSEEEEQMNPRDKYDGFSDGLLYFLTALDLTKRQNVIDLPLVLEKWGQVDPLCYISLLSPRVYNTFLQLYLVNKFALYSDDMLEALIPVFVSYLYFPTNVTSPLSEFLVERACQSPMSVSPIVSAIYSR